MKPRKPAHLRSAITAALAGAALLVSLAGCASAPPQPGYNDKGQVLPRTDLHDLSPRPWRSAEVTGDRTIEITLIGADTCRSRAVELEETDTSVVVSVFSGLAPGRSGKCTLENTIGDDVLLVETPFDIDDRQIVDGHADVWEK